VHAPSSATRARAVLRDFSEEVQALTPSLSGDYMPVLAAKDLDADRHRYPTSGATGSFCGVVIFICHAYVAIHLVRNSGKHPDAFSGPADAKQSREYAGLNTEDINGFHALAAFVKSRERQSTAGPPSRHPPCGRGDGAALAPVSWLVVPTPLLTDWPVAPDASAAEGGPAV